MPAAGEVVKLLPDIGTHDACLDDELRDIAELHGGKGLCRQLIQGFVEYALHAGIKAGERGAFLHRPVLVEFRSLLPRPAIEPYITAAQGQHQGGHQATGYDAGPSEPMPAFG